MALVQVDDQQVKAMVDDLTSLKADSAKAFADITAKLTAAAGTADPATAAAIKGVISDIETLDANTKAIDPGAITPTPTPAPNPAP